MSGSISRLKVKGFRLKGAPVYGSAPVRPIICFVFLILGGLVSAWGQTNTYAVRGVVQGVAADGRGVTVKHEAIPGYMMAMTMDFPVRDTNLLTGVKAGDAVTFTLVVTGDDDWIQSIKRTGRAAVTPVPVALAGAGEELQVGEAMPAMELTDEGGKVIQLADFRGKAVAFTFFFTRCPLPDFCPRMNRNFAEARKLLQADTNGVADWEFLSVSFDAGFDGPETLRGYAQLYRGGDTNGWLFASAGTNTLRAVAPRLDFHFWTENGTFSHNLRTVVVDPNGKVAALFDSNEWTAAELAAAMKKAVLSATDGHR